MALGRAAAVSACGALLAVIALAFGTSPLLVPGVAFLAIGLLSRAGVWVIARGASVERAEGAAEVIEAARFTSTVVLRTGMLGLRGAELADPLGGEPVAVAVGPSPRGRVIRFEVVATFTRRGRKRLPPPVVRVSDALHLASAVVRGAGERSLLVLPRIEPVRWRARGLGGRQPLEHGALADALAASEIDGLRPYRQGTPASRIHWPALARGAGLLERRMHAEEESRPLLVLDSRCTRGELERLDAIVRAAASLVVELARRGGCALVCGEGGRPLEVDARLGGWAAAHTRLALLEPAERPPVLAARRRLGTLLYLATECGTRPPQLLRETGGVLVLPASAPRPGRWAIAFEVADCVGYTLPARGGTRGARKDAGATAVGA